MVRLARDGDTEATGWVEPMTTHPTHKLCSCRSRRTDSAGDEVGSFAIATTILHCCASSCLVYGVGFQLADLTAVLGSALT